ncbi:peptidyl-prolyl cis-trans isomerase sig-7-like [Physella acuta]|uniref:peptidyl-prolyl cis-trans isomerase sig-7-like n=1 Tax=Physella acuta TaxID=109671 RepID=UPI0027DE9727|nr:peptidyl-prolyl cis-trans isomerase sig-7-like [Physella acuta]
MAVIIETSIGDMTVDLYTDERPRSCLNFLKLCKIKYYNFSLFHTVQQNLVAQAGDPTATGRGGESIFRSLYGDQARFFPMEEVPRIKHSKKGLISMVNNGSDMHGSQFFFTLADNLDYLDGKHTVFGEVTEGTDVLEKLNNTFCGEDNRPHQDIRIYHTIILDDPYDDPANLDIPPVSPGPTEEMLNSDHIPCDANIDEDKDKTEQQLAEIMAEKEAKANTQILEMVGDLPEADVAPPENVLFVCKLNPVTTSDDLETIFSRFGQIVSCEVIKDSKTGESLQYAFIEFGNEEDCEKAYFKMDNVLIDDRRIHVDFSQSVSKLKWKGKGRGVEIMETGDAPIYVLKNQQRRNDGYDLVYDEDVGGNRKSKKSHDKKQSSDKREDNSKLRRREKSSSNSPVSKNRNHYDKGNKKSSSKGDNRDQKEDRGRNDGNWKKQEEEKEYRNKRNEEDRWEGRGRKQERFEDSDENSDRKDRKKNKSDQERESKKRSGRDRSVESEEDNTRHKISRKDNSDENDKGHHHSKKKKKDKKRHKKQESSDESSEDDRGSKGGKSGSKNKSKYSSEEKTSKKSKKKHKSKKHESSDEDDRR